MLAQSSDFPPDPERPTFQDCYALSRQYYQLLLDLHKENWSCMQQGPKFGYGPACHGGQSYTAFVSCARFSVSICELDERKHAAETTCRARAEIRAEQERRDQQAEKERQVLAERLKKANDLTDIVRSLPSAISDPKTYFVKAFGANSPVLKQLFQSNDFRSTVNPELSSELYRFAQNYAKTGIQTTSNPVISAIQQEALKRLGEQHKEILQQADDISSSSSQLLATSHHPQITL